MTTDERDEGIATGSVPHAYRNRLFWKWAQQMPARTPSGFVALLYALGAAADPAGYLRFRDGKPITIRQIAAGIRTEEKKVRDYVDAAIAAGVLTYEGSRKRGASTMYVLVLSPMPDWGAAQSLLKAKAQEKEDRRKKPRETAPWEEPQDTVREPAEEVPAEGEAEEEFGVPHPELPEDEFGVPHPELPIPEDDEERGTAPRTGSGYRTPKGSGYRTPNNPRSPKKYPHEMAEVGGQPQVARETPPSKTADPPSEAPVQTTFLIGIQGGSEGREPDTPIASDWSRCSSCHTRMIPRRDRTTHCRNCLATVNATNTA